MNSISFLFRKIEWKSPWQVDQIVHSNTARLNAPIDKLSISKSFGIFNITFESPESQTIDIKIIDVVGEIVYQQERKL